MSSVLFFYELVNSLAREEVDLIRQERIIVLSIGHAFPEATGIAVFRKFYAFCLPSDEAECCSARLQHLGRSLAKKMPGLCQEAMKHYESEGHADSNQLFRRVKGKKRLAFCREQYKDI